MRIEEESAVQQQQQQKKGAKKIGKEGMIGTFVCMRGSRSCYYYYC
jgi:hypothetical protein